METWREELELAVERAADAMPADVRAAYAAAEWSLYNGPAGGGAEMSFEDALAVLRDWADGVDDVRLTETLWEVDEDGVEQEYEVDVGYIDSRDIVAGVIGKALAAYL